MDYIGVIIKDKEDRPILLPVEKDIAKKKIEIESYSLIYRNLRLGRSLWKELVYTGVFDPQTVFELPVPREDFPEGNLFENRIIAKYNDGVMTKSELVYINVWNVPL